MKKYMGLDYGSKTVGVALSDDLGIMAYPYETIFRERSNKLRRTYSRIKEIVSEYNIKCIILGMPINMDDSYGKRCELTEEFAIELKQKLGEDVEIITCDERLSTFEANEILEEMQVPVSERKEKIDKIAASLILQRYMNEVNDGRNNG